MERITSQGSLSYRTKLMPEAKAQAFAACLTANADFTEVSVEESARAKREEKFFVQFKPASELRQLDMLARQIDARASRAAAQGFSFILDKDAGRPFVWVHSHSSGEVYELDIEGRSCGCPDHLYRCSKAGIQCKHALAWMNHVASGGEIRTW
jgi:hypothetical protein